MKDRKLLELAANVAGIELDWNGIPANGSPWRMTGEGGDRGPADTWNPLTDDGDALRLAVKLRINLEFYVDWVVSSCDGLRLVTGDVYQDEGEMTGATRRTIVRAAVALGEYNERSRHW